MVNVGRAPLQQTAGGQFYRDEMDISGRIFDLLDGYLAYFPEIWTICRISGLFDRYPVYLTDIWSI